MFSFYVIISSIPTHAKAKTVLLADDDTLFLKLFSLHVESRDADFSLLSSGSGEETVAAIRRQAPDVLVLDIRMPKGDGFVVLEHLKKEGIDIPVVILTNYRNPEYIQKSRDYGNVKEYIVKSDMRMERVVDTVSGYAA